MLGQLLGSAKNAFLYYSLLFPFASRSVALGGGLGHEGDYGIPQAWSLTAEFLFYLMLPVVAVVLVRLAAKKAPQLQVRYALAICAALYLFGQLFRLYFLVASPSWARVAVIWAPNWVDFFAIGMAMAVFSAAHGTGLELPRILRFLGDHPAISWSCALAVGFSFATFSPPNTPGVYGAEYWVRWWLFGVFAFFLLAPAMFGDQTQGRGRKFLASRPLVLLGTVSLGFYLFHLAVMGNVQEWLAPSGTSSDFYGSLPVVFSLTFVLSIGLAFLSYYLVEKPFLRLKDRSITSIWHRDPPSGATAAVAVAPRDDPRATSDTVAHALGWVAIAAVALTAALAGFFVLRGRLNADEGWYLYSARLVYRGQLPFRDFSFTQMPLLPVRVRHPATGHVEPLPRSCGVGGAVGGGARVVRARGVARGRTPGRGGSRAARPGRADRGLQPDPHQDLRPRRVLPRRAPRHAHVDRVGGRARSRWPRSPRSDSRSAGRRACRSR